MRLRTLAVTSALLGLIGVTACSSPATPTGVSMVAAQGVSPSDGAQLTYASQPITLNIKNGVATGDQAITYTFQVASDPNFTTIVATKDAVTPGTSQTTTTLDRLSGAKTYYWRSRLNSAGVAGPFSASRSFTVGPEVVIQAPTQVSPSANGQATGTAQLVVTNSTRTGPAGAITYRFEVSSSSSFASIAYTTTVAEGSGQTSATVPATTLTSAATYFWRAQALDATNSVTSAFTSASSFQYIAFDMRQARIWDSPSDIGSWTEGARITSVHMTSAAMLVDFDRRDGPNRWPDAPFGDGGDGTIQYTLGMCLNINGQWHCSNVVQFWYGRDLAAGGAPGDVAREWFYDTRWGTLMGHQPAVGETVGIYVGAGNLRGRTEPSTVICPRVCERSDVVMMPFGGQYTR